ncbi:tripartite tricarboxylate transporter substrate binding protein [Cupriavidus malaysiensis]|uniref:tripartite tricarboxylate transporter substrate binding protein n=1 Tax=Cupriavidus malaysiensis TaxID=367825 RepID=UPI0009FF4C6F|nr:tripartite tricarboxylate transporter substrate binding protein [Cupriavidus malaysiensis]
MSISKLRFPASSTPARSPARGVLVAAGAIVVALAAAPSVAAPRAGAAPYPGRPIELVVTFPPGGGTDLLARKLAARLEGELGQPVVVENRAGASGNIGAQLVAHARPDGYTLLMVNSSYAINPAVYRKLGFSPQSDLRGVINVAYVPSVLVTTVSSPWLSLRQALDARAVRRVGLGATGPGATATPAYASCGNGTPQQLAGGMLMRRTGADWLHVPYRGCGPALQAVLAGNVPLGIVTASSALPFIQAGTLRALAVTSPQRSPLLPGVPTVAEQGLPGYALNQWHGVLAPAATPPAIVRRLNSAIAAVMRRPEMAAELQALGYDVTTSTPQEFQAVIERDIARFGELARQMDLHVD